MIEWTVHPARKRPLAALGTLAFVALASTLAALALGPGSTLYAWIFAALLLGSLTSFYFPTTYLLDDVGLTVRHLGTTRRREWNGVRRIELGRTKALLSSFAAPRALDRFRAVVVALDGAPPEAREQLRVRAEALRSAGLPPGLARDKPSG